MANLTPQQIAYYAYNAGFRGTALNQAVAVALAESGGNTNAYNPESAAGTRPGSGSRGLWQIYGQAHPQYNNATVFNPQANANAAFQVWKEAGGRFTPWSTFNAGIAKIKYDFTKFNFSNIAAPQKNTVVIQNPVSSVARGSLKTVSPVAVKQSAVTGSAQAQAGTTQAQTPGQAISSFLGLPKANDKKSGPQTPEDFAFLVIGGAILLIGIAALLIGGYTTANQAGGKFIIKNARQLAPLLAA